jgi:hypothetical protein
LAQQNNVGENEIFTLDVFDLKRIYSELSGPSTGHIKLQIALGEWGKVDSPFRAYYGQVKMSDIAGWAQFGKSLFDKNLRFHRGSTEVNDAMEMTIDRSPEKFWYSNNGITVLCGSVDKTVLNGDSRDYGIFDCQGVSVVNGAQTVGVIWEMARRDATLVRSPDAKVHIRLISLRDCPPGFDVDVTRATNTQNRIQHRDFAALDQRQQLLAREMSLDGRRYAFKSGDPDPKGEEGCNIEEATVALACATDDVAMAVQAKREVGALWRDITKPPYTTLFHDRLSARDVWRAVLVLRAVSDQLESLASAPQPRAELVAVHGNRFILRRVFRDPEVTAFRDPSISEILISERAQEATDRVFGEVAKQVQERYPNAYLANLFKNTQKCKALLGVGDNVPEEAIGDLFGFNRP